MKVFIPGPLRSYTDGASTFEGHGRTLDELLIDLDQACPGLRFRIIDEQNRIREHIKIFVNAEQQPNLDAGLNGREEVYIVCALSGGSYG